jgi:protein-disulfide isomerase
MQGNKIIDERGKCKKMKIKCIFAFVLVSSIFSGRIKAADDGSCPLVKENTVLAEVNGQIIFESDVTKPLIPQLSRLQEQMNNLKQQKLNSIIEEKLLAAEAKKRGITIPALLDAEVTAKVKLVTEMDIQLYYLSNKPQSMGDLASIHDQIRANIQNSRFAAERGKFIDMLRKESNVVVHMNQNPAYRVELSTKDAPVLGPENAPVTIVEFADFDCPFCRQVEPTVLKMMSEYDGKVRFVFRNFPIEKIHPNARKAAEASRCAQAQGKFWEFRDETFSGTPNGDWDDLRKIAVKIGLDTSTFEKCLADPGNKNSIANDVVEGVKAGVNSVPAFFINGRVLQGPYSEESFRKVIEEEIANAKMTRKE